MQASPATSKSLRLATAPDCLACLASYGGALASSGLPASGGSLAAATKDELVLRVFTGQLQAHLARRTPYTMEQPGKSPGTSGPRRPALFTRNASTKVLESAADAVVRAAVCVCTLHCTTFHSHDKSLMRRAAAASMPCRALQGPRLSAFAAVA